MPLEFYLEPFEKGLLPGWDGDGVQGAGQPRDRRGRWHKGVAAMVASLEVLVTTMGGCDFAGHQNHSSVDIPDRGTSVSQVVKPA